MGLKIIIWVIICIFPAVWEYRGAAASESWPTAHGAITSVENSSSKMLEFIVPRKSDLFEETEIRFNYMVADKEYTGVQHSLPHITVMSKFPEDIKANFEIGETDPIKYNPQNPTEAVFPKAASQYTVTALAQGAILAVLGVIVFLIVAVARATAW